MSEATVLAIIAPSQTIVLQYGFAIGSGPNEENESDGASYSNDPTVGCFILSSVEWMRSNVCSFPERLSQCPCSLVRAESVWLDCGVEEKDENRVS